MSLIRWFVLTWMFTSCVAIPRQKKTCNNCYATTSYEIIKHYHRSLNITVKELMQQTKQGCAGGSPETILNKYVKYWNITYIKLTCFHSIPIFVTFDISFYTFNFLPSCYLT